MRYLTPVLAAAIILSTASTSADLGDQLFKLLPDDGAGLDGFGRSVSVCCTTAIVGSMYDDDNGNASGSAYLFSITTGEQLAKLLPNDGVEGDQFGNAVAISSTSEKEIAIIAAWSDDDNGTHSGSAYLFDVSDPTKPVQIAKILAFDGTEADLFGWAVAIYGNYAIVGARYDDASGYRSGSAYLFDVTDPSNVILIAKLIPDDIAEGDEFGYSVAICETTAIVGAWADDDNGEASGSAYLFDTTTGQQIVKLLPSDGDTDDRFGNSVAISGPSGKEIAIVGARFDDDNGFQSGSAYLFNATTGEQISKLLPSDGDGGDDFGAAVAISVTIKNEIAAVGTPRNGEYNYSDSGTVYLFDTESGQQIAKLLPKDINGSDMLGWTVAISGDTVISGAIWDQDNGFQSGSAYLFDASLDQLCPWDLDNSGIVDTSDLLTLFAQWGTDGPADFDGSGVVDTTDLLILFANWGPCG
ncbi:MAG: FG-GAP repeat protein [Planctomycetes bacterium]|nr:FG-GAP repeat protein [Planctomycetota bacterium]